MAAKNSPSPDTGTDGLVPTFVASLAILMAGLLLLGLATDGGRGFTTETLRRSEVSREARALPDFGLIDNRPIRFCRPRSTMRRCNC